MTNYQKNKERARELAINWQSIQAERNFYMSEIVEQTEKFVKLAKRYGLTREFKENGII